MRVMIAALAIMFLGASVSAATEGTAAKARLQAAMQQHIQQQVVDGAILHFDTGTGRVTPLYPTQAHPMVIAMGDHFVLCTDLRDKSGKSMPLDLYMTRKGRSYVVFHSEIDNRKPLQRLLKKGIARPLR
ncbi:MAG: hypothetical protein ACR2RA_22155 [Geminicoccaceae bacterium]